MCVPTGVRTNNIGGDLSARRSAPIESKNVPCPKGYNSSLNDLPPRGGDRYTPPIYTYFFYSSEPHGRCIYQSCSRLTVEEIEGELRSASSPPHLRKTIFAGCTYRRT